MLNYYVLTSRNLKCLKRHFHSLPKEHTTVVINTTDKEYEEVAHQWCWDNKINCVLTESNGMPGKGKNAVLDHFLHNPYYSHMVQIDGDDFLQPHGVNLYKWLSDNNPPDGVQIVYSASNRGHFTDPYTQIFAPMPWEPTYKEWAIKQYTSHPEKKKHLIDMFKRRYELHSIYHKHREQNAQWNYPPDGVHYMDCARLIFWSKKLASKVRFREDLLVGEDSLLNYEVRNMAWLGEITLQKVKDTEENTYTYDLLNCGVTKKGHMEAQWDWMKLLTDIITEREKEWTVPLNYSLESVPYPEEFKLEPLDINKL